MIDVVTAAQSQTTICTVHTRG